MNTQHKKVRAPGFCSGGVDSTLAGLVLREHGLEVEWVAFETPFFSSAKARKASRTTGIPLTVRSIFPDYIAMLRHPRAGYGKQMNPCMDCHALMFRMAGEVMREKGFDFLFSGEVLGQRPMSQTKPSLHYVEKHSGLKGYILKPLSAMLIVGRTEQDNASILTYHNREQDAVIDVKDYPGPVGLLPGGGDESSLLLAAAICVGYSKAPHLSPVDVVVKRPEGETTIQVIAIPPDDVRKLMM
jgi:hypothetical protein